MAGAFRRQKGDGLMHGWTSPFGSAHLALVAKVTAASPASPLPHQVAGGLDVALIGIARLDDADGQAVRAEYEINFLLRVRALRQGAVHRGHERIDEVRIVVVFIHYTDRGTPLAGGLEET